jgi:hypothetical protein
MTAAKQKLPPKLTLFNRFSRFVYEYLKHHPEPPMDHGWAA